MKIGPVDSGDRPGKPEQNERCRQHTQSEPRQKADEVDISDSARTLAGRPAGQDDHDTGIDPLESSDEVREMDIRSDRVERARRRAESGYYDRPEVIEEIARRITDDFAG